MPERSQNQELRDTTNKNSQEPHQQQTIIIQQTQTIRASNILSQLSNNQNKIQQILEEEQSLIQQIQNYYNKLQQLQQLADEQDKKNNDDDNKDNNDEHVDDNVDADDQRQYLSHKHQFLKLQQRYFMPIQEYIDIDKFIEDLKSNRQGWLKKGKQLRNLGRNYEGQEEQQQEYDQNINIEPQIKKNILQGKINQLKFKRNQNITAYQRNGQILRLFQKAENLQQLNQIIESIYSDSKQEQMIQKEFLQSQINQQKLKLNKKKKKKDANNDHFHPLFQIQAKRLKQMNQIKQQMYFILQQNQFQIFNKQQNIPLNNQFFKNLIKNQKQKINETQTQDFQIEILNHTFDQEIIQIYCKYHNIGKKLIILNKINSNIQNHHLDEPVFKDQSVRYSFNWLDQKYFLQQIKWIQQEYHIRRQEKSCRKFQKLIKEEKKIRSIIKTVFILNICAALKTGPYLPKINGFDLIIKKRQIQFFTEEYQSKIIKLGSKQIGQVFKVQIFEDMLKMHSINLLNNCISPSHIGFSKKFQKPILLEYGKSSIMKQNIYQKSFVSQFKGVYGYSSDQMKRIFRMGWQGSSYINLYLNDIHSITQSFNDMHKNYHNRTQQTKQFNVFLFYEQKNQSSTIKREQIQVIKFEQQYEWILQNLITHFKVGIRPQNNINQPLYISLLKNFKASSKQQLCIITKTLIQSFKFIIYLFSKKSLSLQFMAKIQKLIKELNYIYCFNPKEIKGRKKLSDCQENLNFWYQKSYNRYSYEFDAYEEIYMPFIKQAKRFMKQYSLFNKIQQQVEVAKCQNQIVESSQFKYYYNFMIKNSQLAKKQKFYLQQPKLSFNKFHNDQSQIQRNYQAIALNKMVNLIKQKKDTINFITNQQNKNLRKNYKYTGRLIKDYLDSILCNIQNIKKKYFRKNHKNCDEKEVKTINQCNFNQSIEYPTKKQEKSQDQNLQSQFPRLINYIQALLTYIALQKQHRQFFDKQKRKKALQNLIQIAQKFGIKGKCLTSIKRYNSKKEENLRQCKPKRNKINQSHYDYIQVFQIIFIYMNNLMNKNIDTIKNNENKKQKEDEKLKKACQLKFIQKHMFYILKNLIILGFNWQLFIKQYLQKCRFFVLKNSNLNHKLLQIFTKEVIQIGLLIKYGHNQFSYKYYESLQNLLTFQITQLLLQQIEFQSFEQFKSIIKKLQIIQKMWIFVSPLDFVQLNTNTNDIKKYFIQLQQLLKKQQQQNLSLNNNYSVKQQWFKYQNLLLVIKDYYQNYFNLSYNHFFERSQQVYQMRPSFSSIKQQNQADPLKNYYILTKNEDEQENNDFFNQQIQQIQLLNDLFLQVKQKQLSQSMQKFYYVKMNFMKQESQFKRCQYWSLLQTIYLYRHHYKSKINKDTFYKLLSKSLQKIDSILGQQSISFLIHLDLRLQIELWSKNISRNRPNILMNITNFNKGITLKHNQVEEDMPENSDFGIQFYLHLAKTIYLNWLSQPNLQRKQLLEWCSNGYNKQRNRLALQMLSPNSEYKKQGQDKNTFSYNKYLYLKIILFQKSLMQQKSIRMMTQQIVNKSQQIKIDCFDKKRWNLWRQNNYQSYCQIDDKINKIDEFNEFLTIKTSSSQQQNNKKYLQQVQNVYNKQLTIASQQFLIKPPFLQKYQQQQQIFHKHNNHQQEQKLNYYRQQYIIYQLLTKSLQSSSQLNSQQQSTLLLNQQQQLKYINKLNQILIKQKQQSNKFKYQQNHKNNNIFCNNHDFSNNNYYYPKKLLQIDEIINKIIQFSLLFIKNKSQQSLLVINNHNKKQINHSNNHKNDDKNQSTHKNHNHNNISNSIKNSLIINPINSQLLLQNQYLQYKSFITISHTQSNQYIHLLSFNKLHQQLNQQYFSLFIIDYVIHLCKHISSQLTTPIFQSNNKKDRIQQNYQRLLQILKLPHHLEQTTLKLIFQTILLVNKNRISQFQCQHQHQRQHQHQQLFYKRNNNNKRLALFQNIIPILKLFKLNMPSQMNFLALSGKFFIQELLQKVYKEKDQEYENQQQQNGEYMYFTNKIYKNLIHSYRSVVSKIILNNKTNNLVKQTIKNSKFQYHLKQQTQILIQFSCLTYIIQRQRQKYTFFKKGLKFNNDYKFSRLIVMLRKIIRHVSTDNQHQHKNIFPKNFISFITKEFLSFQFQYPKRQELQLNKQKKTKLHHVFNVFKQKMLNKRFRYLQIKFGEKMQNQLIKYRQRIIKNDFCQSQQQQQNVVNNSIMKKMF